MKRLMLLALMVCLPALALSQARQSIPQNPASNLDFLRAQELESKGDVDQAIKLYRMLNQLDPNDLYFWKLVSLYEQTGDWQSMADSHPGKSETPAGFPRGPAVPVPCASESWQDR